MSSTPTKVDSGKKLAIAISGELKMRIAAFGRFGETWDVVLRRLVEIAEKSKREEKA